MNRKHRLIGWLFFAISSKDHWVAIRGLFDDKACTLLTTYAKLMASENRIGSGGASGIRRRCSGFGRPSIRRSRTGAT